MHVSNSDHWLLAKTSRWHPRLPKILNGYFSLKVLQLTLQKDLDRTRSRIKHRKNEKNSTGSASSPQFFPRFSHPIFPRPSHLSRPHARVPCCWSTTATSSQALVPRHRRPYNWAEVMVYQCLPSGNWHSYWKWPFIVDFPIKNGDFP